jgi:hypothetical protein
MRKESDSRRKSNRMGSRRTDLSSSPLEIRLKRLHRIGGQFERVLKLLQRIIVLISIILMIGKQAYLQLAAPQSESGSTQVYRKL